MTPPKTNLAITAGILVGGRGQRLGGRRKELLPLGDTTFLERTVGILRPWTQRLVLLIRRDQTSAFPDYECVADNVQGLGPMGGLESLLDTSQTPWCLLSACDMPRIDDGLIRTLVEAASERVDAVVPRVGDEMHPTLALYKTSLLEQMRMNIRNESLAMRRFVEGINTGYVDLPQALWDTVTNVNTPEDLQELG